MQSGCGVGCSDWFVMVKHMVMVVKLGQTLVCFSVKAIMSFAHRVHMCMPLGIIRASGILQMPNSATFGQIHCKSGTLEPSWPVDVQHHSHFPIRATWPSGCNPLGHGCCWDTILYYLRLVLTSEYCCCLHGIMWVGWVGVGGGGAFFFFFFFFFLGGGGGVLQHLLLLLFTGQSHLIWIWIISELGTTISWELQSIGN